MNSTLAASTPAPENTLDWHMLNLITSSPCFSHAVPDCLEASLLSKS